MLCPKCGTEIADAAPLPVPPPRPNTGLWVCIILLAALLLLALAVVAVVVGAVIIPQQTRASEEARASNLMTNLQTMRSQLLLYKTQHNENYPTDFGRQLTFHTDVSGGVAARPDPAHTFGPYLQAVPVNPISGSKAVRVVTGAGLAFDAPHEDGGWWFNATTGELRADLKDSWSDPDGFKYNAL
jgi:general secretion pathway protein G